MPVVNIKDLKVKQIWGGDTVKNGSTRVRGLKEKLVVEKLNRVLLIVDQVKGLIQKLRD